MKIFFLKNSVSYSPLDTIPQRFYTITKLSMRIMILSITINWFVGFIVYEHLGYFMPKSI